MNYNDQKNNPVNSQLDEHKILEHNTNALHGGVSNRFKNYKIAAVVTLRSHGMKLKDIARLLNINSNTVRAISAKHSKDDRQLRLIGWTDEQVLNTYYTLQKEAEQEESNALQS